MNVECISDVQRMFVHHEYPESVISSHSVWVRNSKTFITSSLNISPTSLLLWITHRFTSVHNMQFQMVSLFWICCILGFSNTCPQSYKGRKAECWICHRLSPISLSNIQSQVWISFMIFSWQCAKLHFRFSVAYVKGLFVSLVGRSEYI